MQTRGAAGRICLPDLADLYLLCKHDTGTSSNSNSDIESSRILLRFILQVKHMVRTTRVAVWLGMSVSYTPSTTLQKMADLCDAYLIVETFVGKQDSIPYEFKDFCGFLYINKLSTLGSLCAFRPPGYKFGLKRDRRKVHVEPLHLPPEESRATASATESDASKMKLIAQSSTSSGAGTSDRVTVGTDSSGRTSSHVGAVSKTIGYEHSTPVTQQPSIQPSIHSTSEREQQSVSARTPAERAAAIAAKLATNAPKGSSISISSVHRKNATQKASENMSGSICSPSSGLNNTNGDLDF